MPFFCCFIAYFGHSPSGLCAEQFAYPRWALKMCTRFRTLRKNQIPFMCTVTAYVCEVLQSLSTMVPTSAEQDGQSTSRLG